MKKMYDTCFFDLDGTITDSSLGITNSVLYALRKYGIEETDRSRLYPFIGPSLPDSFVKYYGFSREQAREAVDYYREYYRDKGIYENRVYAGFEEVLKKLKAAGKRLVVATSKPEPFAREIIRYFELEPYFDYVAGMELDGRRGSKAEVIRYALKECRIENKSRVLMVGDREHDVIGARETGLDCLGVLYGFGTRQELKAAGADYIAETVEEILEFAL